MGKLVDFVTSLHQSTSRKYLDRMIDNKIDCMIEAKNMEKIIGMVIGDLVMAVINISQVDGSL